MIIEIGKMALVNNKYEQFINMSKYPEIMKNRGLAWFFRLMNRL
jgi:UDP-N-acetyl-D-mannosaminuronic acid transferase (WecB/TagA/CpsF family)